MNKILLIFMLFLLSGCTTEEVDNIVEEENAGGEYSLLLNYNEALEIFAEAKEASIYDIETDTTYEVRRIEGGFQTLADVETLTTEDTDILLDTAGGKWNIVRRAVIVMIDDYKIAASISPFQHSGDENYAYLESIDNRSGATGSGVNLDYIRGNGMTGVVDIYFYNSLIPGINRIDERHQEMVLEAYEYEG